MKYSGLILRLLCQLIDSLIWLLPVQFIIVGVFGVPEMQALFLFTVLLAVYETICIISFKGRTLGKYLGKMHVIDKDMTYPTALYIGLRSLTKALYLLPFFGAVVALISLGMYITKGLSLHDIVGRTTVVSANKYKEIFDDRGND